MSQSKVCHKGKVIGKSGDKISVKIEVLSACSKCHAKGLCSAADMSEKVIECIPEGSLSEGDEVMVEMATKFGFKAVMWAFFVPFLIVMVALILTYYITGSEIAAAFASFGVLFPYYLTIYFLKSYFYRNFYFSCRKINNNN
jgi:sigma-E factor negative regulatory protein RseC